MDRANLNASVSDPAHAGDESSAASWQQHEHLSAQLELDATRLLADAGTAELAKFAIDSVEEQQRNERRGEFAKALGFASYGELIGSSAGVATIDDKLWFISMLADGEWISWNFTDFQIDMRHASQEAAIAHVHRLVVKSQS